MNKTSDFFDAMDKATDLRNIIVDMQKQKLIDEITWLYQNYDNIDALCAYWLNCANFNNIAANLSYAQQFKSYSVEKIHSLIELRANFLYGQLQGLDYSKIDTKPLKLIIHELKALEQ